ncbi:MAG: hypothetical protein LN590_04575 [Rickettsia endosymbiont of Glossina mortisans submortisans]|nr:hypothetical protein [Rickettsia endosymbiont of Glossina mortisans submortisans]
MQHIMITKLQLPILPTNPEVFRDYTQQRYNQALTLIENRNYISIIPCLFEAIVREYSDKLLPIDIIYFFQILPLYSSALSKNAEEIIYSSEKLARILGYTNKEASNMRSIILGITKKLEQAGFLQVHRSKNKNGSDKVNKIVPILPNHLYDKIKYESSNSNVDSKRLTNESNLQHIIRTKLFVPITLTFIQNLFKDSMTPKHKLFYLNCIITAYKNYQITGQFSFASTSQELTKSNNISRGTLTKIFAYIRKQKSDFFIKVKHTYTKSDDPDDNRYDKSIFIISINPLVIPYSFIKNTDHKAALEFSDTKCLDVENETKKPDTYGGSQAACQKTMPSMLKNNAYNNKDIIIKKSNKNIDENLDEKNTELDENNPIKPLTLLHTSHSEHLESEQSSLSSKSLKNIVKDFIDALPSPSNSNAENASSTIQDISDKSNKTNIPNKCNTVIHNKTTSQAKTINDRKNKDLRYFYPLSEKDANMLNFKANREFSTNFTNQLLLKLYIKDTEKRFKNKFTFLSYMAKILKNEKHQGPLVNHTSFRFSCNIGTIEKNLLEYEKYLNQIESSFDTSKEMQVRKKIAGRFSTNVAYEILIQVEFKTNQDNSFITTLVPNNLAAILSERQKEALSDQLEAVYGINGYYVQELEKEVIQPPKSRTSDIEFNDRSIGILESSKSSEAITENSAWNEIRNGLKEELGEAIDKVWFSRVVAKECKDTKTLTITMPTRFMADWVKNNYSHVIRRIAGSTGIKMVEYWYEQNNRL